MDFRSLGRNGPQVSVLGFGAFKIGRNEKTKYGEPYSLPDASTVSSLLNGIIDLGINLIDTAPAYGLSEERIGQAISHRRHEVVLSTKIGEDFEHGSSTYDFSKGGIESSIQRSLKRLRTDVLDLVFIHAHGDDLQILNKTDAVEALIQLRDRGQIRQIGLSAKTPAAAIQALVWADALMIEYHLDDRSFEPVLDHAFAAQRGVIVKKALASGKLPAADAINFVLEHPAVCSTVIGTLNLDHMRANCQAVTSRDAPR